ncbi:hypothetical protein OS493_023146 [Desmophyllum pertusum]|uniref:Uncharacterized protein n=1 Tax=Desmophyllum pertusum TaxID=174260 RepID=A0A9X0CQD3_9CNID|nr:hypothetical protein OS493_023146 [Desmophyllum pertusum]
MATVDALFDGSWRSPVSSDLASVSDVISERRVSSESTDSEVLLDDAPSLDDVFDVLDAMDPFRPGQPMNAPLTTPSAHLMGDPSQLYRSNGVYQLPNAHVSSSWNPWNAFQSFNFGLVKGLQNPSRGLITAVRRLCELLSRPRSDHLDSVFVRLLNNLLKEMEDASQPQSKRPRRNSGSRQAVFKRQRKWPNKSTSDAERSFERARIGLRHSFPSMSKSLPAISTRAGRCTEIVDLTGLEDCEKKNFEQQQDSKVEKERFIALEDTMSDFISSVSTLKSLSNASQTQSK